MKFFKILLIILCQLLFSCDKNKSINKDIEVVIKEYSNTYKLKNPNILEKFSAKQSYEVGFYVNNTDTLLYISRMRSYANKELSVVSHSPFREKLGFNNYRILDFPLYMGSYYMGKDSLPIHVYDITDKVGKELYNFNVLSNFIFDQYYITEEYEEERPPDIWIYRIENNRVIKIMETDTISYKDR